MKWLVMPLLGVIFVALIACSIQSIYADHILEDGKGIFKDENTVHMVSTNDSKYQVHVQVSMRNDQGQLISMTESSHATNIPHKITDDVFDTFMGKKKIVTTDGIKYEKVQFYDSYTKNWDTANPLGLWVVIFCEEINSEFECFNIFQVRSDQMVVEGDDVITAKWTIFRAMN